MNRLVSLGAVLLLAPLAFAQPKAKGIESPGYVWNAQAGEQLRAMKLKGDPARGARTWALCAGCHLADGSGRSDGSFPVLAGQHASVVIKQLADIRSGLRDNPIMYPFATTLTDAQELADLAAYVSGLSSREVNGRGPGRALDLGQRLYERDCASCHGAKAQGDASKLFPLLAGQHYRYLLRQVTDIRSGSRRNSNPEMIRRIKPYNAPELEALADYTSRLPRPQRD